MELRLVSGDDVVPALGLSLAGGPPIVPWPTPDPRPVPFGAGEPLTDPDVAVVVGTSGSTGSPKGVVLSRPAIAASVRATHDRLGGPGAWTCPLPLHYVAGLMTLARAWHAGLPVAVVPTDLTELPILDGVRNYLSVVATQLHRALSDPRARVQLAAYDAVLVGGSSVSADLVQRGRRAGINLVVTYGMSETCGGCVYDGIPLDGVGVGVDSDQRIWIGGPVLFSGYRLDPDATAATLVDGRLRTHDRGRFHDGLLQVLGRLDDVVICGGVNVDLAAAQAVADRVFGPAGVILLAVGDERWGARIVAATAAGLDLDEVRRRLAGSLVAEALPRELRRVEPLPRTPTGKIDRRRLTRDWVEGSGNWRR